MSKGITKCCPSCRKILIRYINAHGECEFETKCPHCDLMVKISIKQAPDIEITILSSIVILLFILGSFIWYINNTSKPSYVIDSLKPVLYTSQ